MELRGGEGIPPVPQDQKKPGLNRIKEWFVRRDSIVYNGHNVICNTQILRPELKLYQHYHLLSLGSRPLAFAA